MKIGLIAAAVLVAAWLGLWVTNTGLLVWSSDTGVVKTRECKYLVGVSVQTRYAPLADRCELVRKVGG